MGQKYYYMRNRMYEELGIHGGTDAWYIGPAHEHYRCVECYMPETRSTRITDMLVYFPAQVPFPKSTMEDYQRQSISDILAILNDPKQPIAPFLTFGDDTTNALRKIATLLNRVIPPPPRVLPLSVPVPTPVNTSVQTSLQLPRVTPRVTPAQTSIQLSRVVLPDTPPPPVPLPRVVSPARPRVVSPELNVPPTPRPIPPAVAFYLNLLKAPTMAPPELVPPSTMEESPNDSIIFSNPWQDDPRLQHSRSAAVAHLMVQEYLRSHDVNHMHNPVTGLKETLDSLRQDNPDRWNRSMPNELGRLSSGVGDRMKTETENIFYIRMSQIPKGRKCTYANAVCDYRPLKDDPYRVRLTV